MGITPLSTIVSEIILAVNFKKSSKRNKKDFKQHFKLERPFWVF